MNPTTMLQGNKRQKNLKRKNSLLQHQTPIHNTTDRNQVLEASDSSSLICTYLEKKSETLYHLKTNASPGKKTRFKGIGGRNSELSHIHIKVFTNPDLHIGPEHTVPVHRHISTFLHGTKKEQGNAAYIKLSEPSPFQSSFIWYLSDS